MGRGIPSNTIGRQLGRFGENLRSLRVTKGLSQNRLAELAHLNIRTVQKIEAGQMNILITTVIRIRAGVGCSWDALLDGNLP